MFEKRYYEAKMSLETRLTNLKHFNGAFKFDNHNKYGSL